MEVVDLAMEEVTMEVVGSDMEAVDSDTGVDITGEEDSVTEEDIMVVVDSDTEEVASDTGEDTTGVDSDTTVKQYRPATQRNRDQE